MPSKAIAIASPTFDSEPRATLAAHPAGLKGGRRGLQGGLDGKHRRVAVQNSRPKATWPEMCIAPCLRAALKPRSSVNPQTCRKRQREWEE